MDSTKHYELEKSIAQIVKDGDIIKGFKIAFSCDDIVLVETNCKECSQQLRLFEALSFDGLCENCSKL